MRTSFRQGITGYQPGGFLQVNGNDIDILAANRPVTLTVAHKNRNYTHSEDNTLSNAWVGPFTETRNWLYWDFNLLTFERTFGFTTLEPVAQSVPPGHGDVTIIEVIPGGPGIGAFVVSGYFVLPTNKPFAVINSTGNNGNYTVESIVYDGILGKTFIFTNETVASAIVDGDATLDMDVQGNPLKVEDRHWFDTTNSIHYVLQSGNWRQVLRVFAAQLLNGTTFISFSQNSGTGDFTGTQVGDNTPVFSGRVLFDEASTPIRRNDVTFFTTEDQFFANQSRVDALRLESNVTRAQCSVAALPEFGIVFWVSDGKIAPAVYDSVGNSIIGLLTEDLINGEIGSVILQGVVTNPLWDWSLVTTTGASLWVDNGLLVVADPHITDPVTYPNPRVPVARVLNIDSVIFEQGLGGVGPRGPTGSIDNIPPANTTDIGGVTLVTPSSDAGRAFVISDTDARLTNARIPLAHIHPASEVSFVPGSGLASNQVQNALLELGSTKVNLAGDIMTGALTLSGAPTANTHAVTKLYVDNLVNGLIWLEPIDGVNLISDNVATPPASPNNGDSYIIPAGGGTGLWSAIAVGNLAQWDDSNTVWIDEGPMSDLHGTGTFYMGVAMQTTTTPSGTFLGAKNQIAIFDNSGTFVSFVVPVTNNAVYVDEHSSIFAFDQYVYDGTQWIRFGGSNLPIVGDGSTIDVNGGLLSTIDAGSGGQVDALSISGETLADLDLRYAPLVHIHNLPYDLAFYATNPMQISSILSSFMITRNITVKAGAPDAVAYAENTASDGTYILDIIHRKNTGSPPYLVNIVGTITFSIGVTLGVFAWASDTSFTAGDLLQITTQAGTPDSSLQNLSITIVGCAPSVDCTI